MFDIWSEPQQQSGTQARYQNDDHYRGVLTRRNTPRLKSEQRRDDRERQSVVEQDRREPA